VRLLVLAVCLYTSTVVLTAHDMHVVTVLLQVVKLVSFTYGGKLRLCMLILGALLLLSLPLVIWLPK
jgi:hypothetical protein